MNRKKHLSYQTWKNMKDRCYSNTKENYKYYATDDYYIYTHLTPAAMQKLYTKFIFGWEQQNDVPLNKESEKTIDQPPEKEIPK
ncbi:hypothetical protein [Bacillus thuringiensis]|nr:hypothetical protein [Bacillus thuringiensis]